MNAYKHRTEGEVIDSAPLFASSWMALLLLIRGQFDSANDDIVAVPAAEGTATEPEAPVES